MAAIDSLYRDLAGDLLEAYPHLSTSKRIAALASLIQATVEPWIANEIDNYEPPDPPGWEGGFAENH